MYAYTNMLVEPVLHDTIFLLESEIVFLFAYYNVES